MLSVYTLHAHVTRAPFSILVFRRYFPTPLSHVRMSIAHDALVRCARPRCAWPFDWSVYLVDSTRPFHKSIRKYNPLHVCPLNSSVARGRCSRQLRRVMF